MMTTEVAREPKVYFDVSSVASPTNRRELKRRISERFGWESHDLWSVRPTEATHNVFIVVGDAVELAKRWNRLSTAWTSVLDRVAVVARVRRCDELRLFRNLLVHSQPGVMDVFQESRDLRMLKVWEELAARLKSVVESMSPDRIRVARFADGVLWLAFGDGRNRAIRWDSLPFAIEGKLVPETVRVSEDGSSLVFDTTTGEEFDVDAAAIRATFDGAYKNRLEDMAAQARSTLGTRLRDLRESHSITQAQLADRMGVTQPALSRIEAGRHDPRLGTLQKYAEAVGLSLQELLNAIAEPTSSTRAKREHDQP
jgi:DNA-binding XRE family transcriptional regulator